MIAWCTDVRVIPPNMESESSLYEFVLFSVSRV